jgi:hypothetical protein
VNGARPVSPSKVAAPMKRSAPAVHTVCTSTFACTKREIAWQAL